MAQTCQTPSCILHGIPCLSTKDGRCLVCGAKAKQET